MRSRSFGVVFYLVHVEYGRNTLFFDTFSFTWDVVLYEFAGWVFCGFGGGQVAFFKTRGGAETAAESGLLSIALLRHWGRIRFRFRFKSGIIFVVCGSMQFLGRGYNNSECVRSWESDGQQLTNRSLRATHRSTRLGTGSPPPWSRAFGEWWARCDLRSSVWWATGAPPPLR